MTILLTVWISEVLFTRNTLLQIIILQYVRATQNSIGSNVETLYHILDGKAEALEFKICDNSPIVGRTLSELNLKKNLLVGCLYRDGSVRIPRGHDAWRLVTEL